MSHAAPGQLAAYNSLQDKHLSGYFNNSRMKKHLVKSGLITKKGKIIDEKTYRLNMAKKEHRKHVRDLLATAIIHKALDLERTRQYEIRKKLDEVYKVELVRRVKEDRKKKGDEGILPLLTPRERSARRRHHIRPATAPAGINGTAQPSEIHYDENTGRLCYTIEGGQETAMNSYLRDDEDPNKSPYIRAYCGTYPVPVPPPAGTPRRPRPNSSALARKRTRPVRFHYLARTEPAVAHRVQLQSMAEVTMKFLGPSLILTNSLFPEDRLCEVMVLQQHCGGSTLCVFRELLPPNTIFTFVSRRHRGAPFGLTFYIDSLQDIRLSSCCEYKHKPGHILGGRNGHFQFVQVEGAAPCYRCQVASGVRDHRSKDSSEQEGEEKENRSKTFLTQNEASQSRESFDVIITKVDPSEKDDQGIQRITVETTPSGYKMIIPHSAEKVDGSTQTPRDEKEEAGTSNPEDTEEKEKNEDSSAEKNDKEDEQGEDSTTGKYDDEVFEDEDENEEKSTKDSEDEKPEEEEKDSEKEDDAKTDEYKDDFDSEKEESDKEESDKEETGEEAADETKQDESDNDEIHDEAEKKEEDQEEQEVEVEDEMEDFKKEEQEKQEDNDSVHDSDSDMKPSRTVSFDEDVKIINTINDAADVEDETEEQDHQVNEQEKPEDIPEVPEDDIDAAIKLPREPEVDDGQDKAKAEVDDSTKEVETKSKPEAEVDVSSRDEPIKESKEPTTATTSDENEQDKQDENEDGEEDENNSIGNKSEKIENEKEKPEENENDKNNIVKDDSEKTGTGAVKDAHVEDSVDDSSVKPDDSLEIVSPEPAEIDSSSDSSSSSSSSDSDSDDEKDDVDEPDHDPGKDPDLVAEKLPEQALKVIGVAPGSKHEGSVQPLVEDKKDIELASLVLDSEQVEELVGIIEKKEDVGSITLRNTEINDDSVEKLVEVLKKSSSVKMLNLNVNRVGPQGAQHIADLIRENKSLRMLLLHGNPLQDEGVHHILDAIIKTTDTALNNLDLGDCKMKDDGAKDVARLLLNNTTITDLTISGNNIGLGGWRIISSALEQNKTLKSLSLDFSNLGDDEAVILAEGIKENKGLRSLDLEGNKIGDEGGRSLVEAVKVNPTMVDLTLMPMNDISKDICDEIKGILEERAKNRVSSASSSISSLLSRSGSSRPNEDHPRPSGSFSEDVKRNNDVETPKENKEVSSSADGDSGNRMGDSPDETGKSPSEDSQLEDSVFKETDNQEITEENNEPENKESEEIKEQNDKKENSEDKKETVDDSNDEQKS